MRSPWNLAVWWIAANTLGWAGTMALFEALPNPLKPAACVIIGTAQWLVLRGQLRMSPWWLAGTSLAWFGGLWEAAVITFFGPDPLRIPLAKKWRRVLNTVKHASGLTAGPRSGGQFVRHAAYQLGAS